MKGRPLATLNCVVIFSCIYFLPVWFRRGCSWNNRAKIYKHGIQAKHLILWSAQVIFSQICSLPPSLPQWRSDIISLLIYAFTVAHFFLPALLPAFGSRHCVAFGQDYVFVFVYYSKMVFVYKICCSAVCDLLYVAHVKTHIACVLCDCSS